MKCQNCGSELEEGVLFCRDCGSKVEKKKLFCRECGAKITEGAKFCSNCGANVNAVNDIEVDSQPIPKEEPVVEESIVEEKIEEVPVQAKASSAKKKEPNTDKETLGDKIKAKAIELWNGMDIFCKVVTVAFIVVIVLLLISVLAHKGFAIAFSVLQIIGLVVATLMHKEVIKTPKQYLKYIVLSVAIVFTVLNVMSYSWGTKTPINNTTPQTNQETEDKAEEIDWANIALSNILPKPQSNLMNILYNGEDWLNADVHNISENDFLEYVRWCKDDYGFTIDSDSFDGYFYAYNQEGYCVTLFYDETAKEMNINLDIPSENATNDSDEQQTEETEQTEQTEQTESKDDVALSITKGTEYAYMTDEWNVYIARAISDDIIKIENWDKTMSNEKSVSLEYEVGTFKINDSENSFAWLDDDHTAFVITFTDKNNSQFKKGSTATFTINISDSDKNKGSNYSEKIACYSIQNDDWHMYRAISLTDTLIKIECWSRGSSIGTFLFGYDVVLIDTASGDTDFEWTDDDHTSFSITMKDAQNKSYWKKETFVVFELENEDYKYADVKSYLGIWEVGEGEAAVPASASDFKYDNYQDVQKELEEAGFTNITTEILYDIIWGWTYEGEVDSVSIDGRTNYEKGEVFKLDAPIVITYHMKEEDDPNKPVEIDPPKDETTETKPSEDETAKSPVFYSTNTRDTVDDGNAGVYSYKSKGGSYDIYWIIDFDEGYVYYFTEGNGESTCDRLKIDSGDLNTAVTITYHDGGDTWSYKLHFKYVDHSEHLVMNDQNGFDYDYYTTDLSDALELRDTKRIKDY